MHLVALFGRDPTAAALARHRDAAGRFHLHAVPNGRETDALEGLAAFGAAGALLHGDALQRRARAHVERASLDAEEVGAVDTVTVAAGATVGDYVGGRALGELLRSTGWHARDARAVVVGSGPLAAAAMRELASGGASTLTLLAASAPDAERAVPEVPAGARVRPLAQGDPAAQVVLEEADVLVLGHSDAEVPDTAFGPHLTVVDLGASPLGPVRRRAMDLGAITFARADLEAHRATLALGQVLGGEVELEPFLDRLHEG